MYLQLLTGALVILACVLSNKLSQRFGLPTLLAFIGLGMLFGSDGLFKIPFDDYAFAESICSASLVLIMFYGGFGTGWRAARPVAAKALVLSSLGVVLTAGLTGLFCHLFLGLSLLEGMLLGAVLGSTDAASVFSVLRSKKLGLKYGTASLLEVESGSNDPFAYMLTMLLLSALRGEATGAGSALLMIGLQLAVGVGIGAACGLLSAYFLRRFRCTSAGFDAVFVLAVAFLSYGAAGLLGGNGYLSAYLAGILLGNADIPGKKGLVSFFDGMTGLTQMAIFFLLGLLSTPSRLPAVLPAAILVFAFLTLAARPAAVALLLGSMHCPRRQRLLISWAGLRGAASIVFAVTVVVSDVPLSGDLFHIVFAVVLLSIAVQGTLLPHAARRLHMTDDNSNVMKTFTDYMEQTEVQFIQLRVKDGHPWAGQRVRNLNLPPKILLVMVLRGDQTLTPDGDTRMEVDDIAVLCAHGFQDERHIALYEYRVEADDRWVDTPVHGLALPKGELIVMIQRGDQVVIPSGKTCVRAGDVLVINRSGQAAS